MSRKKTDEMDGDVIIGSGGNKYLDPVNNGIANNQHADLSKRDSKGNLDLSSYTLGANPSLGTSLYADMTSGASLGDKQKKFFGDSFRGDYSSPSPPPPKEKTRIRHVSGDGPKSKLRPSKNLNSAFGRGVPFSGWNPSIFKGPLGQTAIGSHKHFIPNQGLYDAGVSNGPKTIQGVIFNGAFPMINIQQWSGRYMGATYSDAEEDV